MTILVLMMASLCLSANDNDLDYTKSYSRALSQAFREDKFIFAFVYTSWSVPAQEMLETTLKDSTLVSELNAEYVNLILNAGRNKDFSTDFEVHVFPTIMVIDKWGNAIIRGSGFKTPAQLMNLIRRTRSKSRFLRQSIDSIMAEANHQNILEIMDSVVVYRDQYTAKNIAKRFLDSNRKHWDKEPCMALMSEYLTLDKKYMKYVSRHHQMFFLKYDSIQIKEKIAFHIFINSLKKGKRGRVEFSYKPLRRWFRRYKLNGVEKMENFCRIKYLLWGRGPSVRSSINLIENYPETSNESVLYSSVIRILLTENYRRSIDYDELIKSIENTLQEGSYWRYDVLALLYYKTGNMAKVNECIDTASEIANVLGESYTPLLDFMKEHINP